MDSLTCLDCKRVTQLVDDHTNGDTICTECGLVIANHYIDDRVEWRTFGNEERNERDPNRIGGPINPLLKSSDLGTTILPPKLNQSSISKNLLSDLSRTQNLVKNQEDDLIKKACEEIKRMSDALGLDKAVRFRACEILSKVEVNNGKRLRRGKAFEALCAASVSISCRELKFSRTLKEISTVVSKGVELKDINKASVMIKRVLESTSSSQAPIMNTRELVRRFCSKLDIRERETKAIKEAIEIAENFDIRRNPKSVLAAIIFMISHISQTNKRPIREIAIVSEVVENTIKNSVKDIYPYALKIIPNWYACEVDIVQRLNGIISSWDSTKPIVHRSLI